METSILRTISESTAPPDIRQEIAVDAYPLLHYGDAAIWNDEICGELTVNLVHDGLSSNFVTYGYTHLGAAATRFIEVYPTLNTEVNFPGYDTVLEISMVEYPGVVVDVPLNIVVLPCEIKSIDTIVGSEYVDPYSYTVKTPEEYVNIVNYNFVPACDYTPDYTLAVSPAPIATLAWIPDNLAPSISVYTPRLDLAGTYTLTTTVELTDYASSFGTSTYTRTFDVDLVDPCQADAVFVPSITTVNFHAIIGIGHLTYEFPDYPDTVSAYYDLSNTNVGYTLCGLRAHSIAENTYDPITGAIVTSIPQTDLTYITLFASNSLIEVTYGTDDINLAGTYLIELTVWLDNYPLISDDTGRLHFTFHQLLTDLIIGDAEYTLFDEPLIINIPAL